MEEARRDELAVGRQFSGEAVLQDYIFERMCATFEFVGHDAVMAQLVRHELQKAFAALEEGAGTFELGRQ